MSGTIAGGAKTAATNKAKYGEDFYKVLGKAGGSAGKGHKFAHGKLDPSKEGRKGGFISSRVWTPEQRAAHGEIMRKHHIEQGIEKGILF